MTENEKGTAPEQRAPSRSWERPSEDRFRRVIDSAHEAFVSMDAGGFITDWNTAAEKTFGWSRTEALGRVLADMVVPRDLRERHWAGLRRFLETGEGPVLGKRLELRAVRRDGDEFPVELTISAIETEGMWEFHAFLRDISERKRAEEERAALVAKLEALARTDELTGLSNRRAWEEELRRELARAARDRAHLCVALLDLDGFKAYNDRHGHPAGDRLLQDVARIWRKQLRITDVLARYGGEEFAIALPAWPLEVALVVVERLRTQVPGEQTCSAGLATWDGAESPEGLIARVDAALYEAKRTGRDRTVTGR